MNRIGIRRPGRPAAGGIARRDFLARAARAIPSIVAAPTLGRGGATPPSDRIAMGFIGLGGQGASHLLGGAWTYVPGGFAARDDVQVVAVCDVRRERREAARRRCNEIYAQRTGLGGFDGVAAVNDFREVLARSDIDAVLLALPYHWAAPMATLAARAGKDVYCEKPVAITVREGRRLVEACRRFGRVYQAGTQQRTEYGGKFRLACELVRDGRIGQLTDVFAYRSPGAFAPSPSRGERPAPIPDGFDWDLWLGPLPWRPYAGAAGHTLPGLFVGDVNWSPHHYDIALWTLNPDPTAPVDIEYDNGLLRYRFSNGVTLHAAACPGEPVGADGGACFVGTGGRIAVDRQRIVAHPDALLRDPPRPGPARSPRIDSHAGNFLDCVRSRRPAICNPAVATVSMEIILAGGIALALRRSLRWLPDLGQFAGDGAANRLLDYSARPPWGEPPAVGRPIA